MGIKKNIKSNKADTLHGPILPPVICFPTFGLFLLGLLALVPLNAFAHSEVDIPQEIVVGVTEYPPLTMKTADERWIGLSFELWKLIAEDIGTRFEVKEYERLKMITAALKNKEVDLIPNIWLTESNETTMDLSHAYYRSGLSIAVSSQSSGISWFASFKKILSINSLKLLGLLALLSLSAGIAIWLMERRRNREMFGDAFPTGLGNGIWWALVTMTTVGYGDKAPKTIGGRLVAVFWMFFSILLIASYTAVITSSLTASELSGRVKGPRDLPHARVGVLENSKTSSSLMKEGIPVVPFGSVNAGLKAIIQKEIDAFVEDELQLKYIIKNDFPGQLRVLPETISQYYVSMAMPSGSHLREHLNRSLAKITDQETWREMMDRYIGRTN